MVWYGMVYGMVYGVVYTVECSGETLPIPGPGLGSSQGWQGTVGMTWWPLWYGIVWSGMVWYGIIENEGTVWSEIVQIYKNVYNETHWKSDPYRRGFKPATLGLGCQRFDHYATEEGKSSGPNLS